MTAAEPREWLIRKGSYFYRANWCGYTTEKDAAGRYTEAEARKEAEIEPWHMAAVHQDSVPGTPLDDATAELATLRANLATVTAERDEAQEQQCKIADRCMAQIQRATAAEAAIATAKRDAWIAGRDAAAETAELGYSLRGIPTAIRALTPPAEAEGGRQDG